MTQKQAQTQTTTINGLGYALEDLDVAPSVMTTLANMEAARQDSRSLTPEDRAAYVAEICRALKLNPLTRPVQFLALQGREVLYLTRGATDQLAARHGLNRETLEGPDFRMMENVKVAFCKVKATLPSGRYEVATATLKMASPADDLMKVETKAKRRATLSILGIGLLSEEEAESIPANERADARQTPQRETVSATSQPLALPSDAGPSPSQAAAANHYDAAERLIDGAGSLDELRAAWMSVYREHLPHLGPNEVLAITEAKEARKAALLAKPPAPPPDDEPTPPDAPKPRGRRSAKPADAAGDVAPAANDGAVDAPGARSTSGHPMATRAERRAHLATLRRPEDVRTSWRHRAAMPPAGYLEDCADRVCALTPGFGVEDALAYLAAPAPAKASHEPKTRAA